MKCKLCKGETTWDTSIGLENFIVCNDCWQELADLADISLYKMLSVVLEMGRIRKKYALCKEHKKRLESSYNPPIDKHH